MAADWIIINCYPAFLYHNQSPLYLISLNMNGLDDDTKVGISMSDMIWVQMRFVKLREAKKKYLQWARLWKFHWKPKGSTSYWKSIFQLWQDEAIAGKKFSTHHIIVRIVWNQHWAATWRFMTLPERFGKTKYTYIFLVVPIYLDLISINHLT